MGEKDMHGCFLCSSVRRYVPEGAAVSNVRSKAETVGYWAQVGQVKPIGKPFLGFTSKVESSGGLSPLLGALYLTPRDRRMDRLCKGKRLVRYVRYMDDIVLLARTRWQLRRAIAALHEEIAALGLHLHRIKRFIGRTTRGFDFLGYQIRAGARLRPSAEGLGLSGQSPA